MTNESVNTENSVEFQAHKRSVLEGINWTMYPNQTDGTELHIGQVGNYQIYLSESINRRRPDTPVRVYTFDLWEMCVKTHVKTDTENDNPNAEETLIIRPGFTRLITDMYVSAMNIDEAKIATIDLINHWNEERLNAAKHEYDMLNNVFSGLDDIFSKKIAKAKAADSVKTLGISGAAVSALFANNIHVIGELTGMSIKQFKTLKGLSGQRGQEILFALKSMGIIMPAE